MERSVNGKNGRWQLAFWIIAVIVTLTIPAMFGLVIKADAKRASEDQRIEKDVYEVRDLLRCELSEINERLAGIETVLGISKKWRSE